MIDAIGAFGPQYLDYETAVKATSDSLQLKERLSAVLDVFKQEMADASTKDRLKAAMILGAFLLEQGPLNEIFSALITTSILKTTGDPLLAGSIGAGSYALQQGAYGLLTSKGTEAIPRTEEEYHRQFPSSNNQEVATTAIKKYSVLFWLGMSALVMNNHMQNDEQDFKKDAKMIRNWMPALIVSDLIVYNTATYAIDNAEKLSIDPNAITDILTNPLTYFAAFGILKYKEHYLKYRRNLKSEEDINESEPSFLEKIKERFAALKLKKNTETTAHSDTIDIDASN